MIDVRKRDEERVMEALKRAGEASEASRADCTVGELADLIDEVRMETIERCQDEVTRALVAVANGAMTSERLRRLLGRKDT